jgi:hypothetical protein
MWKLIFNTKTNKGTGCNREPGVGEFSRDLQPSECAWFNVYPERYQWNGTGIEERPKETLDEMQLKDNRRKTQQQNKASCRAHILLHYPLENQSSAVLGLYPEVEVQKMRDFIASCIEVENATFDALEAVTTLEALAAINKPIWPEV